MKAESNPLEHLDLVVQAFAETVGFPVFPAVLDVAAPVAYGAGSGTNFFHLRCGVLPDPFGQLFPLYRIGR